MRNNRIINYVYKYNIIFGNGYVFKYYIHVKYCIPLFNSILISSEIIYPNMFNIFLYN